MEKDGRNKNLKIELISGGTHVCWPYAVGDLRFKTEEVPWRMIEIEKDIFMIFAVSKQSDRIAIHSIWREAGRGKRWKK